MSWVYCSKCGEGIDAPTPLEVLENSYQCPHCGHLEDPQMTIVDVVFFIHASNKLFNALSDLR